MTKREEYTKATSPPAVLTYETREKAEGHASPPLWLRCAVVLVASFILAMYLLGLPPLAGALDYTRNIPMSEVVDYAWERGVRTLNSPSMLAMASFVLLAAGGLSAFLYLHDAGKRRVVLWLNLIVPILWPIPLVPLAVVDEPGILIRAVMGRLDGEEWSEGWICFASIVAWVELWMAVGLVLRILKWRRSRNAVVC